MTEPTSLSRKPAGWLFVGSALIVFGYWLLVNVTGWVGIRTLMIVLWCIFYASCLLVMIYGWKQSAALEGMVYSITIFAEAVAPAFCIYLVKQLDTTVPVDILDITAYLMLTIMSCALLIGWGVVLAIKYMGVGHTPGWAKAYVVITIFGIFAVLIWAIISPAGFVGLDAVKTHSYILGVWPPMYDGPMSYVRIVMTITTMFLPWVKAEKNGT